MLVLGILLCPTKSEAIWGRSGGGVEYSPVPMQEGNIR